MALIKIVDLTNTLEDTRSTLLSATNGDGIVSRDDLERLLEQTEEPLKKSFLEFFYDFLRKLENRPRMRVTEEVIDRGLTFIQEEIIPNFEIKDRFLSPTNAQIAQVHESALPLATELIKTTANNVLLSPLEVSEQIDQLKKGLFFDDYGSEAAYPIEPVFLEHSGQIITPDSFVVALGVHPETIEAEIGRIESADKVLLNFIDKHEDAELKLQARSVVDLMQAHLGDLKIIIRGREFNPVFKSEHPVFVVGIGQDGNLAGFQSIVVWT